MLLLGMEFLAWHYSLGMSYYIKSWQNTIRYVHHYFSLPLLVLTLFSPYKRLIVAEQGPGFDFGRWFQAWTFNWISRGIGAIVRTVLIFVAIILLVASVLGGALGLLFWVFVPFLSYSVYAKYKRQPENVIASLRAELQKSTEHPLQIIFGNTGGRFVLTHLGLSLQELVESAKQGELNFKGTKFKTLEDVVTHLIDKEIWSSDFFYAHGMPPQDIVRVASWWDRKTTSETQWNEEDVFGRPGIALDLTFGYTPTLNKYVSDLSTPQAFTHHLIGRPQIVERIERNFLTGQSVFLTGDPGVGKRTTVLEFAHKAATGQLGKKLSYKRVLEFDYNALLAGTRDLNQKKVELNQVLTEAAYAGNVILVIRDLHRLINPDVEGYDFTDIFEALLDKRALQIIAISSNVEYERFLASNVRIRKYFEKVAVVPPTKDEALTILLEAADRWEVLARVTILYQSLKQMLEKSDEYVTEAPFPEKVIEILDAAITYVGQKDKAIIEVSDVNAVLAEKTGISFAALSDVDKGKLGSLEDLIHERLVNQEAAVNLIAKTLRAKTVGVIKEKRPIGSFLFFGPTGVGKTETAKVLARVYFGSEEEIIRFDMAEYSGVEGMDRLIGSVTNNTPGALTTAIKNHPAALLLLDEIEKASREIANLFLTLLDEGYITDAFGKKINCRNLFVVGTSNAGAEFVRQLVQKGVEKGEMQKSVVDHILKEGMFSPEFLNRFDGVVVYEPLTEKHMVEVSRHMLDDLTDTLETKNIHLTYEDSAAEKLAKDGFDPAFGARPMRRIVNLEIGDMLGKAILSDEIKEGDKIQLSADEEFQWNKL